MRTITLTQLPIDHATCDPAKHRTTFDRAIGEDGDPETGQMLCFTCLRPLLHCEAARHANKHPDNAGYQREYAHVDPIHEETCPA